MYCAFNTKCLASVNYFFFPFVFSSRRVLRLATGLGGDEVPSWPLLEGGEGDFSYWVKSVEQVRSRKGVSLCWSIYKLLFRAKYFEHSFSGGYFIVCLFRSLFYRSWYYSLLGEGVRLIVYCKCCGLGCACSLVWRSATKTKDNSPQNLLSMYIP